MDAEAKIIIAFLFNRSGKHALTESELYLPLSIELGWFSMNEAQEFVAAAVSQGLLEKKNGALQPTFPIETITIPVGFAPRKKALPNKRKHPKEETVSETIAVRVSEHTGHAIEAVREEIAWVASEKQITPEVAALLVARKHGLPLGEWYDSVEDSLFKGNIRESG